MKIINQIQWARILAEGAAIVFSILLAFSIDAWWERRSDAEQARALANGLRADFEASQAQVGRWLAGNRRMHESSAELLRRMREAEVGSVIDIPARLLSGTVGAPTYSPTDSTYEAALSSGRIRLITSDELHDALARWRQQLADTAEDELLLREIVVHHLVPDLAKQVRLGGVFEFDNLVGWFMGGAGTLGPGDIRLTVTPELEGVVAERLFYLTFVVNGLAEIETTQAEILRMLTEQPDE
ncbi:MAG: hypothetical protein OEW35_04810 [Gammaproteobacteria bacterium]|nr:hypothetical protein [Gammaproteobacteria bacterium]MDH4256102.1 hypothetical protein [Gammaproteobacteria bacterium]MDH5309120.1 hypothetical protein [Gammaproteobacteria bacterium]